MNRIVVRLFPVFLTSVMTVVITACGRSNSDSDVQGGNDIEKIVVKYEDPADSLIEESIKDLPEEKQDEIRLRRKAALALLPYLKLDGRQYRLDISGDEAGKLGVPEWLYESVKNEVAETNKTIAQMAAEGVELDLPDPEEMVKSLITKE